MSLEAESIHEFEGKLSASEDMFKFVFYSASNSIGPFTIIPWVQSLF